MWTIKVTYDTGNSYNTYEDEYELEITFDSFELAKENLNFIREHYHFCEENMSLDIAKTKEWFVADSKYGSESSIRFKLDNGNYFTIGAPWVGYFEHIKTASIILSSKETSIDFSNEYLDVVMGRKIF